MLSPDPGGREGGVVTWSRGEGGRCCHLVLGGGKCCHLVPGERREVLSPGPRGRERGVVTWSRGEVLSPDPRGEGGVVTLSQGEGGRCCHLVPGGGRCYDLWYHPPPPPPIEQNE